ncbi:MAG: hypothetical protein EOP56_05590 [Sphingobacteriales bacterium]|nr:MAG: hypothetical protein EOP56_05590 [Sphingobacteriales bacterium]
MKYLFLVLSALLSIASYSNSYAAYPIKSHDMMPAAIDAPAPDAGFHAKVKEVIHKLKTPAPEAEDSKAGDGTLGIVSFGLGLGALVLFAAATMPGLGILALVGIACGIGAIVTGAIGLKQRNRGLAIAGLVLGIVEITLLLLTIVLVAMALNTLK